MSCGLSEIKRWHLALGYVHIGDLTKLFEVCSEVSVGCILWQLFNYDSMLHDPFCYLADVSSRRAIGVRP